MPWMVGPHTRSQHQRGQDIKGVGQDIKGVRKADGWSGPIPGLNIKGVRKKPVIQKKDPVASDVKLCFFHLVIHSIANRSLFQHVNKVSSSHVNKVSSSSFEIRMKKKKLY